MTLPNDFEQRKIAEEAVTGLPLRVAALLPPGLGEGSNPVYIDTKAPVPGHPDHVLRAGTATIP